MIDSGSTRSAASRCGNPQCVTWAVCSGIVIDIGSERTICSGFVEGFNILLFSDKHSAMWKHSYVCANEMEQVHNRSPNTACTHHAANTVRIPPALSLTLGYCRSQMWWQSSL